MVFPTFFNLSLNLAIRSSWSELVSSWSCFCWLYRASPSLAAKTIINLISVLTIWWHPCVESSLVLLEEGVCYDQCVLLAKLLSFALLHSVLQGQICLLLQVFLDFLLQSIVPPIIFTLSPSAPDNHLTVFCLYWFAYCGHFQLSGTIQYLLLCDLFHFV